MVYGVRGFGASNSQGLSNEQIARVAPAIFADEAHSSRSARYTFIPTRDLFDGMRKEGFMPVQVIQARSRDYDRRGYAKHLVRFRRAEETNKEFARDVVLVNSHDGASAFNLMAGAFRYICQNGLIFGKVDTQVKVPHKGDVLGQVIEGSYRIVSDFDQITESVERMREVQLERPEQVALATAALQLRFDGKKAEEIPVSAERLLATRRYEDRRDPSLWSTFNVIQENVIRGGLSGRVTNANGQRRNVSTRAVNGIDQSTALNRALWTLADEMAKLKAA